MLEQGGYASPNISICISFICGVYISQNQVKLILFDLFDILGDPKVIYFIPNSLDRVHHWHLARFSLLLLLLAVIFARMSHIEVQ